MKIINVSGFGLSGCTSQADFLTDYAGVMGILSDETRNKSVTLAPYQEFGFLKCRYTFGGLLIAKLPENIGYLPIDDIIRYLKIAVNCWCEGIKQLVKHKLTLMPAIKQCDVLGFKNDPPGVYPLLSTLIPNGMTSAILRDPRDTTFDFNRCYKKEDTIENIKWHCNHYNWHLNYARKQIDVFYDEIKKNYFVHDFENFITSSSHRENYLTRMCGAREKVNCYFDASKSIKNIGLYKDKDRSLVQIIEKECMEHYDSFKSFLRERELLME